MAQKFDDLDKREQRQLISIGCLYLIVLVLVVLAIVFSFRRSWGAAVGIAGIAFLIWSGIKFIYGDEWKV